LSRKKIFESTIADNVARIASDLEKAEDFSTSILASHVIEAIKKVGSNLHTTKDGVLFCYFCNKGPFTKKGYYLHLMRSHYQELIDSVVQESERIASSSKDVEFL